MLFRYIHASYLEFCVSIFITIPHPGLILGWSNCKKKHQNPKEKFPQESIKYPDSDKSHKNVVLISKCCHLLLLFLSSASAFSLLRTARKACWFA